ncbi:translation factor GTPase family protein [Amycolatopsis sp. NPDC051102]|uniref:translation factor GTPase family protein n=1 Tax=Amycolatopsis sp. NPDC051102 TaxID=3155163 RepID=UPI0034378F59
MVPINLGILAHVDAGKTSLTERLLFESGATELLGRVDSGTTRTDSMSLERQRGITIRAAVTAIRLGSTDINLIDTPGHSDFIAEVERALGVLDAAVLVLSAVEGVQPQTVVLWRALQRVGIPTILFINKVDRDGADPHRVVEQVRQRLSANLVVHADIRRAGTVDAEVEFVPVVTDSTMEAVVETDAHLLARWVNGHMAPVHELLAVLRARVADSALFPVVFGSAITGTGMDVLKWVLAELLPAADPVDGESSGVVFAIDHDVRGRKTWVRMWSGELRVRDRLALGEKGGGRVTQIVVPTPTGNEERSRVRSGDIAALRGLEARIGDSFGKPPERSTPKLLPPTLQALVTATDPAQRGVLFAALSELADEDPLIGLDLDEDKGEATVRIHGEVQKEVIGALLDERFGVKACFEDTSVMCVETVVGSARAAERIHVDGNPYLATIGLELEADPSIDGVEFLPGTQRGHLPASFIVACESGVRSALTQGLYGWPVTGCRVTLTESDYAPRQSHAHQKFNKAMSSVGADFRNLAPVVTLACLQAARTRVCEPIENFELEVPSSSLNTVISTIGRLGAVLTRTIEDGRYHRINGFLASAKIAETVRTLPNITGGEGILSSRVDHYEPVTGAAMPLRTRVGPDPRDREAWFRAMPR